MESLQIYIPIIAGLGFISFLVFLRQDYKRRKLRDEYLKSLITGFSRKNINTINNVSSLYSAVFGVRDLRVKDYINIDYTLKKAEKHFVVSEPEIIVVQESNGTVEKIRELIDNNKTIIEELETKAPFEDIPSPERELLEDILTFSQSENITKNVYELANHIRTRNQTILELTEEKRKSKKRANWLIFWTIFFGVLSVILSIKQLWSLI
jgi:hypothetical protein